MNLLFVTAKAPFGPGESFILEEIEEVLPCVQKILVIPCRGIENIFHEKARALLHMTYRLPLFNPAIVFHFALSLLGKAKTRAILFSLLRKSRNPRILMKNLLILPKSVYLAGYLKKDRWEHIHAVWGSTPATMAYILSCLLNIPWSMTLHRWEIRENNLLEAKLETAAFVRCISEHGKNELNEVVKGRFTNKILVIHLGVQIPEPIKAQAIPAELVRIVTPARLLEVKGHRYLIDACFQLAREELPAFQIAFYGDGPIREALKAQVREQGLDGHVHFLGEIPHERLIEQYIQGQVDIVVLPSITTPAGAHEGIPVALMEAMAYGIPAISTKTGGIPELLADGAGILVEEKNPESIASALRRLIRDSGQRREIGDAGRERVEKHFNIRLTTRAFIDRIKAST